jgi:hypothetical protein
MSMITIIPTNIICIHVLVSPVASVPRLLVAGNKNYDNDLKSVRKGAGNNHNNNTSNEKKKKNTNNGKKYVTKIMITIFILFNIRLGPNPKKYSVSVLVVVVACFLPR